MRRAYFQANARRNVYVQLPEEDYEPNMCGRLVKSMYGTCDAAQNWEEEYAGFLENIGFQRGRASPCVFLEPQRNIRVVVHGDDFTVLGHDIMLDWFRDRIKAKFEVKFKARLGPSSGDDSSVRIFNRVVQWDAAGIHYEADQRHAEIIVMSLEQWTKNKRISGPGRRIKPQEETEDQVRELNGRQATSYRALAARINYLSQDRSY